MSRKRFELIATCFDKRGRVISTAINEYHRSHPLMKHFALLAGESEEKVWKHAEVSALIKAGQREVHSLLVQRFKSDGTMALARPCKTCELAIKAYGVKVLRYTSDSGIIVKEIV